MTHTYTHEHTHRRARMQTDRQTGRQADRQKDRQAHTMSSSNTSGQASGVFRVEYNCTKCARQSAEAVSSVHADMPRVTSLAATAAADIYKPIRHSVQLMAKSRADTAVDTNTPSSSYQDGGNFMKQLPPFTPLLFPDSSSSSCAVCMVLLVVV